MDDVELNCSSTSVVVNNCDSLTVPFLAAESTTSQMEGNTIDNNAKINVSNVNKCQNNAIIIVSNGNRTIDNNNNNNSATDIQVNILCYINNCKLFKLIF